jgi:hypothetical protein
MHWYMHLRLARSFFMSRPLVSAGKSLYSFVVVTGADDWLGQMFIFGRQDVLDLLFLRTIASLGMRLLV